MTNKPYILLNSIQRCGNTFLRSAFTFAIDRNYDGGWNKFINNYNFYSHVHNKLLLKIPQEDRSIIQFSNFRDPIEQIPSLFGLEHYRKFLYLPYNLDQKHLNKAILMAINEYREWTSLYLENKSSNLILFEDLKNDINKVLKEIFNILNINFLNLIEEDIIENDLKNNDHHLTEEEKFFMGKFPRGFENTPEYIKIQDILQNNKWINYNFKLLVNEYDQIVQLKRASLIKN